MRNLFCLAQWAESTIGQCEGLVMHIFEGSFGCLKNGSLAPDLGISAYRNNNQSFSLAVSWEWIIACSSRMVYCHASHCNTTTEQSKGRKPATVVRWAVRISSALESLEDVGLVANIVTKVVSGAAADTVYRFWYTWILTLGWIAFYRLLSAKALEVLSYIKLNVCNLKTNLYIILVSLTANVWGVIPFLDLSCLKTPTKNESLVLSSE